MWGMDNQRIDLRKLFKSVLRDKRVLVTGHTGFKGSWLCAWLAELGAHVTGYALKPDTHPNAFELMQLRNKLVHIVGDVRDEKKLARVVKKARPDLVIHMAAQALVQQSFKSPGETFDVNVMGTVNLLEAVRAAQRPCAVVAVTSDKCYENTGKAGGCVETDAMGGSDPYSASKGCAELAVNAYQRSFFPVDKYDCHGVSLASVRAGNVIGGGDWAKDRIVPDIIRAVSRGKPALVRNPNAVRPWQYVLDPLAGYLLLGTRMLSGGPQGLAEAWNFGPQPEHSITVAELADRVVKAWGKGTWETVKQAKVHSETPALRLRSEKAKRKLGWRLVYEHEKAIQATVEWYKQAQKTRDMYPFTAHQISEYVRDARALKVSWAVG